MHGNSPFKLLTCVYQWSNNRGVVAFNSKRKWCLVEPVFCIHICTAFNQQLHQTISTSYSQIRHITVKNETRIFSECIVDNCHVCTISKKVTHLCYCCMTIPASQNQSCEAHVVFCFQFGSLFYQELTKEHKNRILTIRSYFNRERIYWEPVNIFVLW